MSRNAKHRQLDTRTALYLALTLMMLTLFSSTALAVTPKKESLIEGQYVTLGDIFEGVVENADYALAPAPQPGRPLVLTTQDLVKVAEAFQLDWRPTGIYHKFVAKRASTEIDTDQILAVLRISLEDETTEEYELELANKTLSLRMPGETTPSLDVVDFKLDRARGTFQATLVAESMLGHEMKTRRQYVTGRAFRMLQVPVLSQRMRKGDVISKHDIEMVSLYAHEVPQNVIMDKNGLVGLTPRRGVTALKPITVSDVQMPMVVKKGELVTLQLRNGPLSLTMKGKALSNGADGDVVRILNTSSNRVVEGTVSGPQEVIVEVAGNYL